MVHTREPDNQLADGIEETLEAMVPQIESLIRRVSAAEPVTVTSDESGVAFEAGIGFPDGIGRGRIVAALFRYRDAIRLDIQLEHDRMFALPDGSPSERRCFMNDYVASTNIARGERELPAAFIRRVVAGVSAARDAVRRHNRQARGPWDEVRVASGAPGPAGLDVA